MKGYRLILTMPESMSVERRQIMKALGAEIVLTPREKGMPGAIEKAQELLKATRELVDAGAVRRIPSNIAVHAATRPLRKSSPDFPEGLDYLITGVGTGGHITGCAEVLKAKKFPKLKVFAVEPEKSQVIAEQTEKPAPHPGCGRGFHSRPFSTWACSTARSP